MVKQFCRPNRALLLAHLRCVVVSTVIVVVVVSPVVVPVVVSENPCVLSVNSQILRVAFFKFFTDKVFIVLIFFSNLLKCEATGKFVTRTAACYRQTTLYVNFMTFLPAKDPRLKEFAAHVICWIMFILYEITAVSIVNGTFAHMGTTLAYYPVYIALFYTNAVVVLPICFAGKPKLLLFFLLVTAVIGAALFFKYQLDHLFLHFRMPWSDRATLIKYLFLSGWRDLYFVALSSVFWIVKRLFRYQEEVSAAEKRRLGESAEKARLERDIAEIRFAGLQQQINPHFLFNTLNFVYSSVLKLSPAAADALGRLSEIIRYGFRSQSLSASSTLALEVEQIENLIELNRVRSDRPVYIEFHHVGDNSSLRILPLVLLTFAENIFKHGDLSDPQRPAKIWASVDSGHTLRFQVWNLKRAPANHNDVPATGMINTIKRLEYAYPGKYQLQVDDGADDYELTLIVAL